MGAVGFIFRSELRRRWRSWLTMVVLISVVGGVTIAAAAAGRRTAQAFPSFVSRYGGDAFVYMVAPNPKLAHLPNVVGLTEMLGPDNANPSCTCTHPIDSQNFGILYVPSGESRVVKLVSGRFPNPADPDEVVASYTMQSEFGLHIGSVITVPTYSKSQAEAYAESVGYLSPRGPTVHLTIVGFETSIYDFPYGGVPNYDLYATRAFAETYLPKIAFGYAYFVKLQGGSNAIPRFNSEASSLGGDVENLDILTASVEGSIHPQAMGWWILALLSAIVGLAVIGQALFRQGLVEARDYETMSAVGADRRQLVLLSTARHAAVGLLGALGAVVVALFLSPIAPLGEARTAEASAGLHFDLFVLPLGCIATFGAVMALGVLPSFRAARASWRESIGTRSRSSVTVSRLSAAGAPPTMIVGVRNALERRSGSTSIPVRSAVLGTVLAVTALCATAVFGASLTNLTGTPRLYGVPFQLNLTNPSAYGPPEAILKRIDSSPEVTALTTGLASQLQVNGVTVGGVVATVIKGPLQFSTVDGSVPTEAGQIGLGAETMKETGSHVGSNVSVTLVTPSGQPRTTNFRVVSQIVFPVLSGFVGLGRGALMTEAAYSEAACPSGATRDRCESSLSQTAFSGGSLIGVAAGPEGEKEVHDLLATYGSSITAPTTPTALVNFGQAVNFPLLFGVILAAFGAATLGHLLVVSVSRRRREVGLLKALGFVNAQVRSAVAWQATCLACIGLVIGVPLGIGLGIVVWHAFASNLGVIPVGVVPTVIVVLVAVGVLAVANVLAIAPALFASRSKPGELLRTQ